MCFDVWLRFGVFLVLYVSFYSCVDLFYSDLSLGVGFCVSLQSYLDDWNTSSSAHASNESKSSPKTSILNGNGDDTLGLVNDNRRGRS